MARHRTATESHPTAGRPAVEAVLLPAVPLVTIGPESPCWGDPEGALGYHPEVKGAIVRVRPPVVSDAVLARVVGDLKAVALAVRTEARRRPAVVPGEAMRAPLPAVGGARAVVMELVTEAFVEDKASLREMCGEILAVVGL